MTAARRRRPTCRGVPNDVWYVDEATLQTLADAVLAERRRMAVLTHEIEAEQEILSRSTQPPSATATGLQAERVNGIHLTGVAARQLARAILARRKREEPDEAAVAAEDVILKSAGRDPSELPRGGRERSATELSEGDYDSAEATAARWGHSPELVRRYARSIPGAEQAGGRWWIPRGAPCPAQHCRVRAG
ncbi:hypothetical protein [Kineosporia sp. R_H_3]|uniref:hypothetical protein n=1 Tax=Kineosporia sp. R_H_3 TaxID=1961848 RepID=UPI000B4C17B9|nr:hypothetical protein [Kineosporia sp. R_H_3]